MKQTIENNSRVRRLHTALPALLVVALGSWSFALMADTKVRSNSFEYDAQGMLVKEVVEFDSPSDCLQTKHSYDASGSKSSTTTSACAGVIGNAISSATTYDPRFGSVTSLTAPNGLATLTQYDGFGRKIKETLADATYTTWVYKLCTDAGMNCPGPIGGTPLSWVVIEQSFAANAMPSAPEKRQFYDTLNRVARVH